MASKTPGLRPRHRAAGAHAPHPFPARAGLRRAGRRAVRRRDRRGDHPGRRRRAVPRLQLFTSDKLALASIGAKEVTPAQAPELHAIIERLCVQADLPKPRVAIADNPMPNAFAMGRSQKKATVCATTRHPRRCSRPAELEGVMAHELTHVANRDVMVMTLASFFASVASLIVQFGFFFGGGFGGGDGRRRQRQRLLRGDPRLRARLRASRSCCCGAVALPRVRRRPRVGACSPAAPARWPRRC